MKVCKNCGRRLPLEMFAKSCKAKNGRASKCRDCKAEYYKSHKDAITERVKEYRETHKEVIVERKKKYYEDNKAMLAKRHKQYRKANKDAMVEYQREYRKTHKEDLVKYREGRKEITLEIRRNYRQNHLGEFCVRQQKREALKLGLPSTLTFEQWELMKKHFNNSCCYCGRELPLHQEHFLALSKGGEYSHNNIVPSCQGCNSSKGPKDFFDWYPKYRYYSKKREKIILKFLNYKNGIQQLALI